MMEIVLVVPACVVGWFLGRFGSLWRDDHPLALFQPQQIVERTEG